MANLEVRHHECCMPHEPGHHRQFCGHLLAQPCLKGQCQPAQLPGDILHGLFRGAVALRTIRKRIPGNRPSAPSLSNCLLERHDRWLSVGLQADVLQAPGVQVASDLPHDPCVTWSLGCAGVGQRCTRGLDCADQHCHRALKELVIQRQHKQACLDVEARRPRMGIFLATCRDADRTPRSVGAMHRIVRCDFGLNRQLRGFLCTDRLRFRTLLLLALLGKELCRPLWRLHVHTEQTAPSAVLRWRF